MAPQKTKNQALRPSRRAWFSPHHSEEALRHRRRASYYTCTLLFAGGSVGAVRRVAGPSTTAGTAACARITSGAGITPLFAGAIAGAAAVLAAGILAVAGLITGIGIVSAGNRADCRRSPQAAHQAYRRVPAEPFRCFRRPQPPFPAGCPASPSRESALRRSR